MLLACAGFSEKENKQNHTAVTRADDFAVGALGESGYSTSEG